MSGARNRTLGILRLVAVWLLVLVLLSLSRPTPLSVSGGFVLVALGQALRVWAAGHLFKTQELITSGPYRHTRNPLYLGRLLIFSGLAVMALFPYGANFALLALGWAVFFGYYLRRKERVEPARLRRVHGAAYEDYHAAVPALWPARRAYPRSSRHGWSSVRLLHNREHWMAGGVLLAVLFLLWRAYHR